MTKPNTTKRRRMSMAGHIWAAELGITKPSKTVQRYAVTYINKDGQRTLALANQGRNHFDTPEACQALLDAIKTNTSADTLRSIYGDPDKLEVRPVECYENGDAIGVYFNE